MNDSERVELRSLLPYIKYEDLVELRNLPFAMEAGGDPESPWATAVDDELTKRRTEAADED